MSIAIVRPDSIKGVRLENLPPEAWQQITGGDSGAHNVHSFYKVVPWLNRGVNLRADAVSAIPYTLRKIGSDQVIENPEQVIKWWLDMPDLLDHIEGDRTLYGAAYLEKLKNAFGIDKGARRLDPTTIRPKYSKTEGLQYFERNLEGKTIKLTPGEEIAYSWVTNRKAETGPGTSAAQAALAAAGVLKNIDVFAASYFGRGAINTLLIDVEEGNPSGSDMTRLEEWIKRRVQGIANAFSVNVGKRRLNVHELGSKAADLALPELSKSKREDIATALGVPQSMLFSNAANYAVAESDTLNFHDKTVIPEARKIEAFLNKFLFNSLGYVFAFEYGRIAVFQKQELNKSQGVRGLFEAGIVTRDEAREILNMETRVAPKAAADDTPAEDVANTVKEVFGYHIELGVVTPNEARQIMGLDPLPEGDSERLRDVQRRLAVVKDATAAGLPLENAAKLAGLDIGPISTPEPATSPVRSALQNWRRKAIKRFKESRSLADQITKAVDFVSSDIPTALHAAIVAQLEECKSVEEVRAIFDDALAFEGYP